MTMDRKLLTAMLASRTEITADGATFAVEGAHVSLLLRTGSGGHVPLQKVSQIELGDDFATITADSADICLPYESLVGLKVEDPKGKSPAKRTGFLA
jgi:hypothetical protein